MFASWWQVGHHLMEAPVPGRTTKQRAAETKGHFSKHETVISLLKHKNIFPPHFPTALTRPGLFMCVERHQLAAVHRELCRDDGRAAARSFDADVKRRVATGTGRRLPGCWRRFVSDARCGQWPIRAPEAKFDDVIWPVTHRNLNDPDHQLSPWWWSDKLWPVSCTGF